MTWIRRLLRHSWTPWSCYLRARHVPARGRGSGAGGRHALLVAWEFPPAVTGGVYRPGALVKHAVRRGWRVSVIAGPGPEAPTPSGQFLAREIPAEVRVRRTVRLEPGPYPVGLPVLDGGFLNALAMFDEGLAWLAGDPPGVVIGSGPPFHVFPAAWFLARRLGARLVLDYRDEWTQSPFAFVASGGDNPAWERRCLARADRVVFTTGSQLEHQCAVFRELRRERCLVIPNGWEPAHLPAGAGAGAPEPRGEGRGGGTGRRKVLAFFGNLSDHSFPREVAAPLASAFAQRPELAALVELQFVGQRTEVALERLAAFPPQACVRLVDQLTKPAALERMRRCDALLLFNGSGMARYLPGKLFDYVAAGVPILVLGSGGEVGRVVEGLRAGLVVEPEADAILDALGALSEQRCGDGEVREWLDAHRREVTSGRFVDLLETLA